MNDEIPKKRGARVALTKKEAAEDLGRELIRLSREWLADGRLDERELDELKVWLAKIPDDALPAIRFLKEEVERYLADGVIYEWELLRLQAALIRILPPEERAEAKAAKDEAARKAYELAAPERKARQIRNQEASAVRSRALRERYADEWANEPATDAQLEYIRDLGGSISPSASKLQASDTIDRLLGNKASPLSFGCMAVIVVGLVVWVGVTYFS